MLQTSPWNDDFDRIRCVMKNSDEKAIHEEFKSIGLDAEQINKFLTCHEEDRDVFISETSAPYWQILIKDGGTSADGGWHVKDFLNEVQDYESGGYQCVVMSAPPSREVYKKYLEDVLKFLC